MKSSFPGEVYKSVSRIPSGRVATYGQIAALLAAPQAARQVGFVLGHLPAESTIPWWRVINAKGMISIENLAVPKPAQAARLQADGVEVELKDGNYWVDLGKYLWKGAKAGIV